MSLKSALLGSVIATAAAGMAGAADLPVVTKALPPAAPVPFFLFSDTTLSNWYEFSGAEPGVGRPIQKDITTITHIDAWKYGTNFVNIDFLKSDKHDPANPWGGPAGFAIPPGGAGDGALEVYGLFRSTLSWNALTNSKMFSFGPVKDISFEFGADGSTKNTAFAPQKRDVVAGLQVSFDVPGFFNVAVNYYKEWNHNGIVPLIGSPPGTSENVDFRGTVDLEAAYMQPLAPFLGGFPLRFSGFTDVVAPKGRDGFGNQTVTELFTDNRLTLDWGKLAFDKPNLYDVFVGYRYWQNKFGNNHNNDPTGGATENTWYVGLAWHAFSDVSLFTSTPAATPGYVKAPPLSPPKFFLFADTTLSNWYEFTGAEPGVGKPIQKDITTITHIDAWKYGANFVNIDFLKSDNHDPAAPWGDPIPGFGVPAGGIGDGALEMYGLFRSTLSWNALTNSKMFSFGPVKDISFEFGADGSTKNTAFAPQKRDVVAGLQVAFDVPGFWNIAVNYYKEWNHNGIAPQLIAAGFCSPAVCAENVDFKGTVDFESAYLLPLAPYLGGVPLRISGFNVLVAPKGKDGFGNQTVWEYLSDTRLVLDVGKLAVDKPNLYDVFVGYRYWQNKFGNNHNNDPTGGATESTFYVGVGWHVL